MMRARVHFLSLLTALALGVLLNATAALALPEFTSFTTCKEIRGITRFGENRWSWAEGWASISGRKVAPQRKSQTMNSKPSSPNFNVEPYVWWVRGGVIGEIMPTNRAVEGVRESFTLSYAQARGRQTLNRLTGVEREAVNVLEAQVACAAPQAFGRTLTDEVIPVEREEIRA